MKRYIFSVGLIVSTMLLSSCKEVNHHADSEHHHDEHKEHEGLVIFSDHQAHHIGLQVDTVRLSTFSNVIKVSGEVQSTREGEQTVVSPVSGVVTFRGKN